MTLTAATSRELTASHNASGDAFDQDVKGGIFLPDDEAEYFAVAMLKTSGGTPQCEANIFVVGVNFSGDKGVEIFDTGAVIEKTIQREYSPVSLAAGDFTGSGNTDQIAFTTSSATGIELTVCKLEKDSGGNYFFRTDRTDYLKAGLLSFSRDCRGRF